MRPPENERRRLRPALIGSVFGVLVAGAMTIVRIASLVALVYVGVSPAALADGLALALIGTSIATVWVALRSSVAGVQAGVQGVPTAILAVAVAGAAAQAAPGAEHGTVLAAVVVSGVLTGLATLMLGLTGAARLVRYLPHPVVAGVLGASGWVLVASALRMMAGGRADLYTPEALWHWLPGVTLGVAMYLAARLLRHPMVVPATLLAATAAFFGAAALNGWSLGRLAQRGWLFGPFPDGSLWRLPPVETVFTADWAAVLAQLPAFGTAALVVALLVVLYTGALELEHEVDAVPGRELREVGIASLLGAVFAGFPATVSPAGSRLAVSMRVRRRSDAAITPLLVLAVLASGAGALEALPRPVLGAVLVYLGVDYLSEYVLLGWRRLSRIDMAVVIVIVGTVAVLGLLPGVAVGLTLTVILFVVASAGTDVIGDARTGRELRSRVTRSAAAREALSELGGRTVVYRLEGTVFFGTVDRLLARAKERLGDGTPVRYLVLDVAAASTFDATGGVAVVRIARAAERVGAEVIIVGAGNNVRRVLSRAGARVVFEADLDGALERCENGLLAEVGLAHDRPSFDDAIADLPGGRVVWSGLRDWFERVEATGGEVVLAQGDPGDDFWILADGRVSAVLERADGSSLRLESLVPGQVIGELGFITDAPRSANIVADERSVLYRMNRASWSELSISRPDLAIALRDMLLRLSAERVQHLSTALATARA